MYQRMYVCMPWCCRIAVANSSNASRTSSTETWALGINQPVLNRSVINHPHYEPRKWCTGKPDPSNLYQDEGWWLALAGVETCQWSTTDHLDPPDLSWHGCYSDWGPAASGGQTILANDRNSGRLRLIASRHYYDYYYYNDEPTTLNRLVVNWLALNHRGILHKHCQVPNKWKAGPRYMYW